MLLDFPFHIILYRNHWSTSPSSCIKHSLINFYICHPSEAPVRKILSTMQLSLQRIHLQTRPDSLHSHGVSSFKILKQRKVCETWSMFSLTTGIPPHVSINPIRAHCTLNPGKAISHSAPLTYSAPHYITHCFHCSTQCSSGSARVNISCRPRGKLQHGLVQSKIMG